ncbi:hypothetical protein NORO109296_18840 [Nocardiopsis rhodophaea]
MHQHPPMPQPELPWGPMRPPRAPESAADTYGAQYGPPSANQPYPGAPQAAPHPAPRPPMAPLPAATAQAARQKELGDPLSVHSETGSPWRGGLKFLISVVALFAVPVVLETSGWDTPDVMLRLLLIAPAVTFLLWMVALNRRRKSAYVFEHGFMTRKGRTHTAVNWGEIAAFQHSSANHPAGDIKIRLHSGEKVRLRGMHIPGSVEMFPALLRAAAHFGWPPK